MSNHGGQNLQPRKSILYIDAHCHLQDPRIREHSQTLLSTAAAVGVMRFVVNGTSEEDWVQVCQLAANHSQIIPSVGLHPWWVPKRTDDWLQQLEELVRNHPQAAVGECGLDKAKKNGADIDTQVAVFRPQLELARQLARPVAVHCVKAYGRLLEILKEMGQFPCGVILHSYVGPPDMVKPFAAQGAYFSLSGLITSLPNSKAASIVRQIPEDRLLLETDSPDGLARLDPSVLLATSGIVEKHSKAKPASNGGRSQASLNEPANIVAVAEAVARLLECEVDAVADRAYQNSLRIFKIQNDDTR